MTPSFRTRLAGRVAEVAEVAQAKRRGEMPCPGVRTGIDIFDDRFGGYPRQLVVIGMDSSAGKSSAIVNLVSSGWRVGVRSRIDSHEDAEDVWQDRFLAWETGINSEDIEAGRLTYEQEIELKAAVERIPEVSYNFEIGRTPKQVCRQAEDCIDDWDVLYVDYLQTLAPDGEFEATNEFAKIANAVRCFAWAASKWKKPVVLISQFTKQLRYRGARAQEKNKNDWSGYEPTVADLFGGNIIFQKCRLLLLAHRPKQYNRALERETQIWQVAKRNRGRQGMEYEFDLDITNAQISNGRLRHAG